MRHIFFWKIPTYEIKLIPKTKLNETNMTASIGDLFHVIRIQIDDF